RDIEGRYRRKQKGRTRHRSRPAESRCIWRWLLNWLGSKRVAEGEGTALDRCQPSYNSGLGLTRRPPLIACRNVATGERRDSKFVGSAASREIPDICT